LLALLPFGPEFFARYGVDARFVGHPLAYLLPLEPDRDAARAALGLACDRPVLALMPGSRGQEVERLSAPFVAAGEALMRQNNGLQVIVCLATERHRERLQAQLAGLPAEVFIARSHDVLTAADVAIAASGTVTLEALLCGTPIVVGYRLGALSYHIIKRMMTIGEIALPNILSQRALVPELIQSDLTPLRLADAVQEWLDNRAAVQDYYQTSRHWHQQLRCNAAQQAADAVLELCAGA